jgi:hypothetical protein
MITSGTAILSILISMLAKGPVPRGAFLILYVLRLA